MIGSLLSTIQFIFTFLIFLIILIGSLVVLYYYYQYEDIINTFINGTINIIINLPKDIVENNEKLDLIIEYLKNINDTMTETVGK